MAGPEAWRTRLANGDATGAWNVFIESYRPLIIATIRRTLPDPDDRMDAFAHICDALAADDLARLQRYEPRGARARFSTWLVTVVHNQVVDWVRRRDGRPRTKSPDTLSPLQQRIFAHVFVEQRSHAETFELVRAGADGELAFSTFLRELADTYRIIERTRPSGVMHYLGSRDDQPATTESAPDRSLAADEIRSRLAPALGALAAEERVALRLYVIEKLPAADVARVLGWAGPKTVYNRVYRTLMRLRDLLERQGVGPIDF